MNNEKLKRNFVNWRMLFNTFDSGCVHWIYAIFDYAYGFMQINYRCLNLNDLLIFIEEN